MKYVLLSLFSLLVYNTQALADHPRREDMPTVRRIAHNVAESTEHVHMQAEHEADSSNDPYMREALGALHELAEAAEHFHYQVESYWQDPQHTEDDFYRLMDAYREARYQMYHARFSYHVMRDFRNAAYDIHDLNRYYRYRGHGHHSPANQ